MAFRLTRLGINVGMCQGNQGVVCPSSHGNHWCANRIRHESGASICSLSITYYCYWTLSLSYSLYRVHKPQWSCSGRVVT